MTLDPTPESRPLDELLAAVRQQMPAWLLSATPAQQRRLARHERQVLVLEQALSAELGASASLLAYSDAYMSAALKPLVGEAVDPGLLVITTQRDVLAGKLVCAWPRSVSAIAAYGLPAGDETPGSAFLTRSTLTYDGAPLPAHLATLTPQRLATLLAPLQLRVDFHRTQASLWTDARQAMLAQLLLARADASAYEALLRGDLSTQDQAAWKAALNAKAGKCQKVVLDNAPAIGQAAVRPRAVLHLNGLMVVRHRPTGASADSFLLYAADAPGERQWWGGLDEAALEAMLTGWCGTRWLKAQVSEDAQEALAMALREPRWLRWDAPTPQRLFQLRAQWQAGRQQALQQRLNPAWYINAPLAKRRELLRRETSLQLLREHVQAYLPIPAFQPFARDKAAALLATLLGEEADPDTVLLTAFSRTCTFTELVITGLQRAFEPPFDLTLVAPDELGYVHRPEHERQVSASGPAGLDLSPLTWERLEKDVDGQWLADQYAAHVQTQLLDASAAGYTERRALYAEMARQDFQRAALAGALQGSLAAGQQALVEHFAQPLGEADDWVELFSLQIEVGSLVNVHKYPWLGLLPKGQGSAETVEGLWVFKEGGRALVYTPGAPDGLEFRPLSGMARAVRRQDMADYLLARLRVKVQDWMTYQLRAMGDGAAPGPQVSKLPVASLHEAFYDQPVRWALARVSETYVGQAQALRERIERALFAVELVLMVATLPFPPAAFELGTLFALKDLALAIEAQQRGDKDAVPGHALGAALNALGALGDVAVGAKGAGAWLQLAHYHQEKLVGRLPVDLRIDRSFALRQPPAPLEAVSSGLFAGTWRKDAPGFSSSYIRDEAGRWFRVQRATDRTPLELLRVVSEHGERRGPTVYRDARGLWRCRREGVGLAGGQPRFPATLQAVLRATDDDLLRDYFFSEHADDLVFLRGGDERVLQQIWDLFDFDQWPRLEAPMVEQMTRQMQFPAWGKVLLGLPELPLGIVQRRFPETTEQAWRSYCQQFGFGGDSEAAQAVYERVLAVELAHHGQTPEWLRAFALDLNAQTQLDQLFRVPTPPSSSSSPEVIAVVAPRYEPSGPGGVIMRRSDGREFVRLRGDIAPVWGAVDQQSMVAVVGTQPNENTVHLVAELRRHDPLVVAFVEGQGWTDQGKLFPLGIKTAIHASFPHFDTASQEVLANLVLRRTPAGVAPLSSRHLLEVRRQIQEWGATQRTLMAQPMDPLSLLRPSPLEYLQVTFPLGALGGQAGHDLLLTVTEVSNSADLIERMLGRGYMQYYLRLPTEGSGELVLASPVSSDVYLVLPRHLSRRSTFFTRLMERPEPALDELRRRLPDATAARVLEARSCGHLQVIVANLRNLTSTSCIKLMKFDLPAYGTTPEL